MRASARTQSSIAVSTDDENWLLINVSPDIRAQLEAYPPLSAQGDRRGTGITAILLMDSQIDHTAGLLMLREGCPLRVYCTDAVYGDLSSGFPIFTMLSAWNGGIDHRTIECGHSFTIPGIEHLRVTPVQLAGKAPPYSPHRHNPLPGHNIGVLLVDERSQKSLFYAPGLGAVEPHLTAYFRDADCLLLDGTFWREDEMLTAGVGSKLASEMGHLPQAGAGGMIEALADFPGSRKILIHINNTNPILDEQSAERMELRRHGIEVAHDGLEILL